MILYLDTSALAKKYLLEEHSAEVVQLMRSSSLLTSSRVAYPEVRAAMARALRVERITEVEHGRMIRELAADWRGIERLTPDEALALRAGDLTYRYALRGFDAIHLASALTLQEGLGEAVSFSSFDSRLNEAAADCGLAVV